MVYSNYPCPRLRLHHWNLVVVDHKFQTTMHYLTYIKHIYKPHPEQKLSDTNQITQQTVIYIVCTTSMSCVP